MTATAMSARGVHFSDPFLDDDRVPHNGDQDKEHQQHIKHPSPPPSESSMRTVSPTNLHSKISSSFESNAETSTGGGTSSLSSKNLRANLTRQQKNRDPMLFYEITAVLGVGSMGSVAKVRKRSEAIGGSARKYNQERVRNEARLEACWNLPLVGGFFRDCLKERVESVVMAPSKQAMRELNESVHRHHHQHDNNDDGTDHSNDFVYAMKSIHLSRVTDPMFVMELKNEIEILKSLDHPHIVKAIETFEHRQQIFVIMELCSGGDLYTRDPYTEEEAARITSCILSAVSYMHSRNILHRDLKYENILFVNDSVHAEIKLIDFGLSRMFATANEQLTEGVGTIYTMAPEVLRGSYTKQADLWSIGVIAYMLMSSQMPFYGRQRKHIVEQIMNGQYEFKGRRWKRISKAAKAFVADLLVVDPNDRATAAEASSAMWLNRRMGATVRNAREDEISNARSSILKYSKYSKLQKMALMVIAHKSTSAEIGILRKIFYQYDTERDGMLSYDEFKSAMKEVGLSEDDYRTIFNSVDLDGTGKIRYTEFLAATIEAHGVISEERLAEAFDRLDADDSGFISAENLAEMLGNDFPKDEIQSILREASQDGKVTYADFLALWESRKEKQWRKEDLNEFAVELAPSMSTDISVLSNETHDSLPFEDDKEALMARASFIDGKKMSERKLIVSQVPSEFKESSSSAVPTSAECNKEADGCRKARVMFSDDAPAIILPAVTGAKSVESVLTGDV